MVRLLLRPTFSVKSLVLIKEGGGGLVVTVIMSDVGLVFEK